MSSTLYVDSLIEKTSGNGVHIPGHVVQVVTFEHTGGEQGITSTSDVATAYTLTISPKFASSKIVIMTSFDVRKNTGTTNDGAIISLYRNGTKIRDKWAWVLGYHLVSSSSMFNHFAGNYTDNPNTTSALTYTVHLRSHAGGDMRVGDTSSGGSLIEMEIAQ